MTLQILVVEDNLADVHMLRTALADIDARSVRLIHADSLGAAFAKADGVHAVVLDPGLPDSQGEQTVRDMCKRTGAPVIVVSGEGDYAAIESAIRAGADQYHIKSSDIRQLAATLVAVCVKAESQYERQQIADRQRQRRIAACCAVLNETAKLRQNL